MDVSSVSTGGNSLTISSHGLATDDVVTLVVAGGSTLPSPLAVGTTYYARRVSEHVIELASTSGGAAIDITTAGSGRFSVVPSMEAAIESHLETWSRWVDGKLVGHQVPLESPYPAWVTYAVAVRAACSLLRSQGIGESGQRIYDLETDVLRDIPALVRGTPLRDANATSPANLARYSQFGIYVAPNRGLIR